MVRIDHVDGGNGPALGGVVARAGGGGAVGGGALFVTTSSGRALFGGEKLDCVLGSNATAAIDTIDDCGALGGRGGGGGSEQVKREEKDQKMHCNGQIVMGKLQWAKRWVDSCFLPVSPHHSCRHNLT
jgi:hypothetical protein